MKKLMRRSIALLMMLAMILAATSTTFAATSKTVKKKDFSTSTKVLEKSATKVKKGTTKLVIKKGQGYIKFVAPKTKKYSFTFSNVTTKKRNNNGFVSFQKPDADSPEYSFHYKVKTKGGKTETLWLSVNGNKFSKKSHPQLIDRPIASRTGTVSLKKGEVIYMYLYFSTGSHNAKLVIK